MQDSLNEVKKITKLQKNSEILIHTFIHTFHSFPYPIPAAVSFTFTYMIEDSSRKFHSALV